MFDLITLMYGKIDRFLARVMNALRLLHLRLLGAHIGRGVRVYGRFVVHGDARNLRIDDGSTINEGVLFDLRDKITIGRGVRLSSYVQLRTSRLDRTGQHSGAPIVLSDRVWLASGVVVSDGVIIGSSSVIGANSVVVSNIGPDTFAVGLPARPLKSLN